MATETLRFGEVREAVRLLTGGAAHRQSSVMRVGEATADVARQLIWRRAVRVAVTEQAVILEAAAVSRAGEVIVFIGGSGSGKSTLALAASAEGWQVLTDEACLITMNGEVLTLGIWGQSRAPIPGAPRLGDRWLFAVEAATRRSLGEVTALVWLPGPVPTDTVGRIAAVASCSYMPPEGKVDGVDEIALLSEIALSAPMYSAAEVPLGGVHR